MGFERAKFPFVAQSFLRASYLETNPNNSSTSTSDQEPPLTPRSSAKMRRLSVERPPAAAASSSAASVAPRAAPYSFWNCLEQGDLREVELFVFGGQELTLVQKHAATAQEMTPLQLVCKAGHAEIVRFLLENGAPVDQQDTSHRTPLLIAAKEGHTEICKLLIAHNACLFATDALDNTPLHCAAFSGCKSVADLILEAYDGKILTHLAELPQKQQIGYSQILTNTFSVVMHSKLRENERRKFHSSWCWDALLYVYKTIVGLDKIMPFPKFAFMQHILERYHPRFLLQKQLAFEDDDDDGDSQNFGNENGDSDDDEDPTLDAGVRQRKQEARASDREWIQCDEMVFCVDLAFREGFKNALNKQGRTALHVACEENLVCTHELMIACLAETHGCDPELKDHTGCTPVHLILTSKGRPGSPRGNLGIEHEISIKRRLRVDQNDNERELQNLEIKRNKWHNEIVEMAHDFHNLDIVQKAKKTVLAHGKTCLVGKLFEWEMYQEPFCRNRLFLNTASGFVQRQVPAKIADFTLKRLAWKEKLDLFSHFVEQNHEFPEWEIHRVNGSDVYFFFNRMSTCCQWLPPVEIPLKTWKTKRIFQDQVQLDDCDDLESLKVEFSGNFTLPLRNDCVRGRKFGETGWRECEIFNVVFYWHENENRVVSIKPEKVLEGESFKYAEVLIRERSEEIDDFDQGWKRYYDMKTSLSFYYENDTSECVLDANADRDFLKKIKKNKNSNRQKLLGNSKEERMKRLEEHQWKQALEHVRKREIQQQEKQFTQNLQMETEFQESEDSQKEIQKLEASVTSEHYDEQQGRPLAYVDARFQRENEVHKKAKLYDSMVSQNPRTLRPRDEIDRALELTQELDTQEKSHAHIEDTPTHKSAPCSEVIVAKDRNAHRRAHLISSGVVSFVTAEIHEYKVPKGIKRLKIQAWGAGGGSGLLKSQSCGSGGGGAFVEGVCVVYPGETLFFAVGSGGSGGKHGTVHQGYEPGSEPDGSEPWPGSSPGVVTKVGVAQGGSPGGGLGHAGNKECACGAGGGFTSVYRHSAFGIEYILIAGGGGGGGTSRHGGGGSGLVAPPGKDGDDPRSGRPGSDQQGGAAGECDAHNPVCRFAGTPGQSMQGGNGAEYGGGGGGGLFGGGGGGFSPGIVGGGGGGSSYINQASFETKSVTVQAGTAVAPGGLDRKPPRSVRTAYWDFVDGNVGQGGTGATTHVARGNHGGVRIAKPGFYNDMHHHI